MNNLYLLSLAACVGALAACSAKTAPSTNATPTRTTNRATLQRPSVAVKLGVIQRTALSGSTTANGTVVAGPNAQATLAFPSDGQIASVAANVGDHVLAGQTLAMLDARVAQRAVDQAQADVAAARAALERAQARARPQEVAQNSALASGAQAKLDAARAEFQREQSLASAGIASRRDLEQARAAYGDARAEFQAKQQEGSLLRAGPRPQDVAVAQAQLQQAEAALNSAVTRASLTSIVSPFSGVVNARMKNAGEVVDTTTPVLTIVDPSRSVVDVQLSEDQAALVRPGDSALIVLNGGTKGIPAKVQVVGAAFSTDTRTLTARVAPLSGKLIPGASAEVEITVRVARDALVVPEAAVVKDPNTGKPEVFVPGKTSGTYERVPVQIVLESGARAAVSSNRLRVGQRVVTQGAYELLPFAGGNNDNG